MAKKTACPITREQFHKAQVLKISIAGQEMEAPPKFFSTGSLGWYLNTKVNVVVDGVSVPVQVGLNLTLVGSKDLPKEEGAEPAPAAASPTPPPASQLAISPAPEPMPRPETAPTADPTASDLEN